MKLNSAFEVGVFGMKRQGKRQQKMCFAKPLRLGHILCKATRLSTENEREEGEKDHFYITQQSRRNPDFFFF